MYYNNLNYVTYAIENGTFNILKDFFFKYHDINELHIYYPNYTEKKTLIELNEQFKYYDYNDWINYKSTYKKFPNYLSILDNELKYILYDIYKDDIIKYQDVFYNKIHNNEISNIPIDFINNDFEKINCCVPLDFDIEMYRELNPDLINMSDFEAKLHYINHGINE
jgi:hypothetical protein